MQTKSGRKRTAKLEDTARTAFCAQGFCAAPISVVIPARNEEIYLPHLIRALQKMPEVGEILVCDGGSSDQTTQIAREMGARVLEGAPSRGAQQNQGASVARGEILWFLHADALPDPKCARQIVRAIERGNMGGNFRLRFDLRGVWPRVFESITRFLRVFGVYYGDSGIFVSRLAWNELGGFRAWPLFEDFDFARRLEVSARREKRKTACCVGRLRVSARRFEKSPLRVLGWWIGLQIGFNLGVSPYRLARFYGRSAKK